MMRLVILVSLIASAVLSPADAICYPNVAYDVVILAEVQYQKRFSNDAIDDVPSRNLARLLPEFQKVAQKFPESRFGLVLVGDGIADKFFRVVTSLDDIQHLEQTMEKLKTPTKGTFYSTCPAIGLWNFAFDVPELDWAPMIAKGYRRIKVVFRLTDSPCEATVPKLWRPLTCEFFDLQHFPHRPKFYTATKMVSGNEFVCPLTYLWGLASAYKVRREGMVAMALVENDALCWGQRLTTAFEYSKVLELSQIDTVATAFDKPWEYLLGETCARHLKPDDSS